ncbi:hypothetical protein [Nocardia brevicatena]|uniref:hypothetical protein n=1 Tax=Nocardia brevicatena TaxID=37327 RepID=UPI0003005E8D|nr:hypothetical protein [Nocardia brevicatena]
MTILRHRHGRTDDGDFYTSVEEIRPGDPGYAAMLPAARANPIADSEPEPPVNAETLARILRDAGLDESDFEDS